MRNNTIAEGVHSPNSTNGETPLIFAYSANPALSQSTIAACVHAGASGVLKPPYNLDTARILRRMARAAKEGRISSLVGLANHNSRPQSPGHEDDGHKVILPPTALSMGGEHEGEKVLSSAYKAHRRGTSASFETWSFNSSAHSRDSSTPVRKLSQVHQCLSEPVSAPSAETPVSAVTPSFPEHPDDEVDLRLASLLVYNPIIEQKRRRSVDISGLGLALQRAQRAFETVKLKSKNGKFDFSSLAKDDSSSSGSEDTYEDGSCADTQLAELLSAMFYQTQLAIQIDMDEYNQ